MNTHQGIATTATETRSSQNATSAFTAASMSLLRLALYLHSPRRATFANPFATLVPGLFPGLVRLPVDKPLRYPAVHWTLAAESAHT